MPGSKAKLADELSGSVCFSTITLPSWRLLKVQVTVSPAWTLKLAVRVPALPEESLVLSSTQLIEVRSQFAFASS